MSENISDSDGIDNRLPPPNRRYFLDLEEAKTFVKDWAKDHHYYLSTLSSKRNELIYKCSQGGVPKP
jgi:predicted nucleic acid binding AN1-type Zn finger protein